MDLKAWRESRIRDVTLPSGLQVKISTSMKLADFAAQGRIPTPLAGLVNDYIDGKDIPTTIESLAGLTGLWDLVAKAAILSPAIADEGDAEHLGVNELSVDDKSYIFNVVHGRATQLIPFRPEQGSDVGTTPDSDKLQPEAQPDPEDPGRMGSLPVGPGVPGSGQRRRRGKGRK